MRPKVVILILGLSGLLLFLVVWLKTGPPASVATRPDQSTPAASPATISTPPPAATSPAAAASRESFQHKIDAAEVQEQRQDASQQRVSELARIGATKDAGALPSVLSDLTNDDATIRQAALSAAVDYGNRNAIPVLQQAADTLTDPREKVNILQAIDYLKLPTFTEMNAGVTSASTGSGN